MAFTIPNTEPTVVMAGEDWHWTIFIEDFPPSEGWTLKYYFAGPSVLTVTATAQVAQGNYDVKALAANTLALLPGRYVWQGIVSGVNGETHLARPIAADDIATSAAVAETQGVLTVLPNITTAAAGDLQTHAEKTLSAIETEIYNRINNLNSIDSYIVAGRSVSKIPFVELVKMRSYYQALVRRERNPGSIGTDVAVSFGLPT